MVQRLRLWASNAGDVDLIPGQRTRGASQAVLMVKNLLANAGDIRDVGFIPGLGRSRGGGNGDPLQYSCLENSMDRGVWWVTVHAVTKSWMRLVLLVAYILLHRG